MSFKVEVSTGNHKGHTFEVEHFETHCGVIQIDVTCSCGAEYHNAMNGCLQHRRPESGDPYLNETLNRIYAP